MLSGNYSHRCFLEGQDVVEYAKQKMQGSLETRSSLHSRNHALSQPISGETASFCIP